MEDSINGIESNRATSSPTNNDLRAQAIVRAARKKFYNVRGEGLEEIGKRPKLSDVSRDLIDLTLDPAFPKFGAASTIGRRRDMEDTITIYPFLLQAEKNIYSSTSDAADIHYFGVYDGHGCSHVATRCKEIMHKLVKEEMHKVDWAEDMKRSFQRMDEEATLPLIKSSLNDGIARCRCELKGAISEMVGSAVIVTMLTPNKIIVSNCGDCRAILSRGGKVVPLSVDHKPDRPDELQRIQALGGRVLSWDGPRVEGVLAMSRAIGDAPLKPFVSCEPEVRIVDRTDDDDCLILASDGFWDVVSNTTACGIVNSCLKMEEGRPRMEVVSKGKTYDRVCRKAASVLTSLATLRKSEDNISVIVVDLRRN